jgi:hypothetical protein
MTANTPRSRKSKGAKFQKEIKELLMETFTNLEEGDILPAVMGESGMDIKLSPAARKVFPFAVEAKCQEKVSLRQWWEQAKANSTAELAPLLITKQSRKEPLVVMDMDTFIKLISHD